MAAVSSSSPSPSPSPRWSELPSNLLELISSSKCLKGNIADFTRFRSVCTSWRSAAKPSKFFKPNSWPWLLLHYDLRDSLRIAIDPATMAVYKFDLPEFRDHAICASIPDGRLVTVHSQTLKVSLLNPLTRARTHLRAPPLPLSMFDPQLEGFWQFSFRCYAHPLAEEEEELGTLLAFFYVSSCQFVYCRSDDEDWTVVHTGLEAFISLSYQDRKFYAISPDGDVAVCDGSAPPSIRLLSNSNSPAGLFVRRNRRDLLLVDTELYVYKLVDDDVDDQLRFIQVQEDEEGSIGVSATFWTPDGSIPTALLTAASSGHDHDFLCQWTVVKLSGFSVCCYVYGVEGNGVKPRFCIKLRQYYTESTLQPCWFTPRIC